MKQTGYKIISGNMMDIEKIVQNLLEHGWQSDGGLIHTNKWSDVKNLTQDKDWKIPEYAQVLVKFETEMPPTPKEVTEADILRALEHMRENDDLVDWGDVPSERADAYLECCMREYMRSYCETESYQMTSQGDDYLKRGK